MPFQLTASQSNRKVFPSMEVIVPSQGFSLGVSALTAVEATRNTTGHGHTS